MTGYTPSRNVRVEDDLWDASKIAAAKVGTTQSEVMRAALVALVCQYNDGEYRDVQDLVSRVARQQAKATLADVDAEAQKRDTTLEDVMIEGARLWLKRTRQERRVVS